MTGAVAVPVPLKSQQQLLARLLHLSRLDTDFIFLTGPQGAGKSYMAALLADRCELQLPVILDAQALNTNARFRDALLGHWFPGGIFDADEPLADSMQRLLAASPGKRLLLVDDAEWLTDTLLAELWQLYLLLPPRFRPCVLLLGSPDWARQARQQLDESTGKVLEVEVPPLDEADKEDLWHALGYKNTPDSAPGGAYPGDASAMKEPQMRKTGYQQLLEQRWIKVALTALILLGLFILIMTLLGDRQPARPEQAGPSPVPAREAPLPVPAEPLTLSPSADEPAPSPDDHGLVQEWANETLPDAPQVATRVAETPDDSDKERVVIEDEVVSRLLQREREGSRQDAAGQAAQAEPPAGLSPLSVLMQKPAQRYTLQLMAGKDRAALYRLASRHTLTPAWIYPRTISGQPWFVLVFGDFDSPEQARRAIGVLSSELQAAKPWPKPFGQVQKEVKP
ncbi:hypothetical protein C7H85_07910 [Zobellella endophytica]|uniref:SPOR domain-containing protein n=1 Tax=Zobellella endophytica TaxID=2116700 RepID=A0A2P7R8I0_9GAMM|nr:AAA family ATPase [Zobellella endophytica]PSJ46544.1 hypothetical protein C7H85_07910 [Zobellella endophytica]